MTAEATGVKKVTVTFNKAVGSDTKITLTKGTTTVSQTTTIAGDGKSATLDLAGKLTAGTYTVTVVAGDDTLTADIVTKDEVLTSFELGSTLKEYDRPAGSTTTTAIIAYKALNQYGETINYQPKSGSVTVSIGKVDEAATTNKPCKTSGAGTITVTDIPQIYAIAGQSFTFVIVDTENNTGVTLNTTAVYGQKASAKTMEFAGVYNKSKSAFKDMAEDDKIEDYELLFTAKDQYGDDMDSKDIAVSASNSAITVTVAGGLTNLASQSLTDTDKTVREIGDKTYFAVPLTGAAVTTGSNYAKANAGTATVTIVNNTQGVVYTGEITVTSGVVVKDITVAAKDLIYASEDNELDYTVTDTNGNTVTDYATLKGIKFTATTAGDNFYWKKNADGSAKLLYNPAAVANGTSSNALSNLKNSEVRSVTITANKAISGNLKVSSKTFTVYHAKVAQSVSKLTASTVCVNATEAAVKLSDIVLLDQWYNTLPSSSAAAKAATVNVTTASAIADGDYVVTGTTVSTSGIISGGAVTTAAVTAANKLRVYTGSKLKLNFKVAGSVIANDDGYETSFTSGSSTNVSGLQITSINGGKQINLDGALGYQAYVTAPSITVKGMVNGVLTEIPSSQYKIVEADAYGKMRMDRLGEFDKVGAKTETRKLHVIVNTNDGEQTIEGEYTVSNLPGVTASIQKVSDTSAWGEYSYASNNYAATGITSLGINDSVTYANADSLFLVKDQYGSKRTGDVKITYTAKKASVSGGSITIAGETKRNEVIDAGVLTTSLNGTTNATAKLNPSVAATVTSGAQVIVEIEVTATSGDQTATETVTATFTKTP